MSSGQETENATESLKEIHFNRLNDDCLLEIFKNLTEAEKLEASLVCSRWAFFLAKNLHVTDELINEITEKAEPIPFLINFIKTCGNYVNSLKIKGSKIGDGTTLILKEAGNNCKNIINLEFHDRDYFDVDENDDFEEDEKESKFNENDFELIFENNTALRSISLYELELSGKSLLKLRPHAIEEFVASCCTFTSNNNLIDFLSQLKNVKKLVMTLITFNTAAEIITRSQYFLQKQEEMKAIKALNKSNCESISELSWYSNNKFELVEINELANLLLKQRELKTLVLQIGLKVDEQFLDCIPKDYLQVLELGSIANLKNYSFHNFKSLKVLKLAELDVTDEFIKELTECKNLKDLEISNIKNYLLSGIGEQNFGELESLESFKIRETEKNIDNILIALSQCKNLKILVISYCKFLDLGIKGLYACSNLRKLDVSSTNIKTEQLKELAKNLSNLIELKVSYCDNVSRKIVTEIETEINCEKRQHVLKIIYEAIENSYEDYDSSNSSFFDEYYDDDDFDDYDEFNEYEGFYFS